MRTVWNKNKTAVKIYGKFSPLSPVIVTSEVVSHFGSIDETFHRIKEMANERILPRLGSESHPLNMLDDLPKAYENRLLGYRHWQYRSFNHVYDDTGYDTVWGYGHYTPNGSFVIKYRDGEIVYRISPKRAGNRR